MFASEAVWVNAAPVPSYRCIVPLAPPQQTHLPNLGASQSWIPPFHLLNLAARILGADHPILQYMTLPLSCGPDIPGAHMLGPAGLLGICTRTTGFYHGILPAVACPLRAILCLQQT